MLNRNARHWDTEKILSGSRCFERGWTLQELIAPRNLAFFDSAWLFLGKTAKVWSYWEHHLSYGLFEKAIARLSGICASVLCVRNAYLKTSIAQRLSYAAKRSTTRTEDISYCLLGLLDVKMPLLYSEGPRAFIRLQEELLRTSSDQSVLMWEPDSPDHYHLLLAPHQICFRNGSNIHTNLDPSRDGDHTITNRGLRTTLPASVADTQLALIELNCTVDHTKSVPCTLIAHAVESGKRFLSNSSAPKVLELLRDPSMGRYNYQRILGPEGFSRNAEPTEVILLKKGLTRQVEFEISEDLHILKLRLWGKWVALGLSTPPAFPASVRL